MSVVNWKHSPYDVYIGRFVPDGPAEVSKEQCIYGNPFVLNDVEDEEERTTCLSNYEQWLLADEQRELVSRAKSELAGKVIACWCKPKRCHGDILLRTAQETEEQTENRRKQSKGSH